MMSSAIEKVMSSYAKNCRRTNYVITKWSPNLRDHMAREAEIARPERFELATDWFVVNSEHHNYLY